MTNYRKHEAWLPRRKLLHQFVGLATSAVLTDLLPATSAWPDQLTTQLGPEVLLGQLNEGQKVSIPPNSLLTGLQLGKEAKHGPRWLNITYRSVLGDFQLQLGNEHLLPTIVAPKNGGGSGKIHLPEGTIFSALQLGGELLTAWYCKVNSPSKFTLGPEEYDKAKGTKEPDDNGGGNQASWDGYTMSGFQWMKDPGGGGTLALHIWYRRVQ